MRYDPTISGHAYTSASGETGTDKRVTDAPIQLEDGPELDASELDESGWSVPEGAWEDARPNA